jgi:hypothetical protein
VESYPEALWINIMAMKNEVNKAMCRGGQWDGRTVSAKISANPSFFHYLKNEMEESFGDELWKHTIRFSRSKKVMYANLAVSRQRIKYHREIIHILSEEELEAARKVLGSSFAIGVLQPIPSLKQLRLNPSTKGTVWLSNDDPVWIVSCCQEGENVVRGVAKPLYCNARTQYKNRPMKFLCSYGGLDIQLAATQYGVSEITVQCRFVKVRGDSKVVWRLFVRTVGDSDASNTDSSIIMVAEGDFITLDCDRVYKVKEVLGNGTVRCVSPANEINDSILISMEEANEALNRQYR